ncbi:MAG: MCP four helix bundle domain-containing protein [Rhodocyclaceae bacterium]
MNPQLSNSTHRPRLLLASVGILGVLCACLITLGSVSRVSSVDANLKTLTGRSFPQLSLANRIIKRATDNGRLSRTAILLDDPAAVETKIREMSERRAANGEDIAALVSLSQGTEDAAVIAQIVATREALSTKYEHLFALLRAGDDRPSRDFLFDELAPMTDRYIAQLESLAAAQDKRIAAAGRETEALSRSATQMLIAAIVLSLVTFGIQIMQAIRSLVPFFKSFGTILSDDPNW